MTAARGWLTSWKTDPDVARDPRVIIPVFADLGTGVTTYWAVIGVKALVTRAQFVAGHEPMVTPTPCWTGQLVPHRYTLLVEETAEVRLASSTPTADARRAARPLRRAHDQGRDCTGARRAVTAYPPAPHASRSHSASSSPPAAA